MPNATKRALAASLKRLLETTPLDKITIQNLVDDAEVSRKTFYYHFQDIYDLLEWGLADQVNHAFEGWATADGWEQGLERIFASLEENRTAMRRTGRVYRPRPRAGDRGGPGLHSGALFLRRGLLFPLLAQQGHEAGGPGSYAPYPPSVSGQYGEHDPALSGGINGKRGPKTVVPDPPSNIKFPCNPPFCGL